MSTNQTTEQHQQRVDPKPDRSRGLKFHPDILMGEVGHMRIDRSTAQPGKHTGVVPDQPK